MSHIFSSVPGFSVANVFPDWESTHLLLRRSWVYFGAHSFPKANFGKFTSVDLEIVLILLKTMDFNMINVN